MALTDEVQGRFGSTNQRLIQLTNYDGTATTINATVLGYACTDAEGHFRRVVGVAPDYSKDWMVSVLVQGVIAYLESYKGSDNNVIGSKLERYDKDLFNLRKRGAMIWETTSVLTPSDEKTGAKPDMDRKGELSHIKLEPSRYAVKKTIDPDDEDE